MKSINNRSWYLLHGDFDIIEEFETKSRCMNYIGSQRCSKAHVQSVYYSEDTKNMYHIIKGSALIEWISILGYSLDHYKMEKL